MPLPQFLVIGETKCGTTSLFDNMVQHPKILAPRQNNTPSGHSINFFDKHWNNGVNWYKSCFYHTGTMYLTGEASPTYLYRAQSLNRISETCKPDVKLIVCLRNPVDRLYSHYFHMRRISDEWNERYPGFEDYWHGSLESDYYLIEKGLYHHSVSKLMDYFKYNQCLFVRSEDMFEDPDKIMGEVFDFLGVAQLSIEAMHFRKNKYQPIPNDIRKEVYKFYETSILKLENLINRRMHWDE